ncbi:MAG: hypothetical protein H0X42_04365 [Solirubrobacterales bacterium]|nr:hypothetical protein [Solirubrobacterales bacterium]
MRRLPREITPGAAARRTLLADCLIALVLALAAIALAAGIGVVGFAALLVLLVLVLWIAVEAGVRRVLRRRRRSAPPVRRRGRRAQVEDETGLDPLREEPTADQPR